MFLHGKSTSYECKNFSNWFHQHQLGNTYKNFNTVMAAVAEAKAPDSMDERIAALQQILCATYSGLAMIFVPDIVQIAVRMVMLPLYLISIGSIQAL